MEHDERTYWISIALLLLLGLWFFTMDWQSGGYGAAFVAFFCIILQCISLHFAIQALKQANQVRHKGLLFALAIFLFLAPFARYIV